MKNWSYILGQLAEGLLEVTEVRERASFGIWDFNGGANAFCESTRTPPLSYGVIELLGRNRVKIALHDDDVGLSPVRIASRSQRDATAKKLKKALVDNGVNVNMYTPCLFRHRVFRTGSVTSNDPDVRAIAMKTIYEAIDRAEELGAKYVTFWLGADGAEVDAVIRPDLAYERILSMLENATQHIMDNTYEVRLSLEPKPNEPPGDSYLATVGTALGLIGQLSLDYRALIGVNPEVLQHEAMTGLNAYHALGQLICAQKLSFVHLGGQRPGRFDQDMPFAGGGSNAMDCMYVMLALEEGKPDCTLEFDCHPYRGENGQGWMQDFVNTNLVHTALMLKAARALVHHPRLQALWGTTCSSDVPDIIAKMPSVAKVSERLEVVQQELDTMALLALTGNLDLIC